MIFFPLINTGILDLSFAKRELSVVGDKEREEPRDTGDRDITTSNCLMIEGENVIDGENYESTQHFISV